VGNWRVGSLDVLEISSGGNRPGRVNKTLRRGALPEQGGWKPTCLLREALRELRGEE